ncbi:MAG: MATE family efflux transporter [Eubacteriales bacterium]|nr:MATE family efflux transporter [Eubacteriales bacterium]
MRIQLSDHFTYKKLLRFTIPSIIMMVCTSMYSIIDGLFVSNFVGKTPFAALNLMYPIIMAFSTVGFMLGTGGSAIVAITLGKGEKEKANEYFSMLIYIAIGIGLAISAIAILFMRPIALVLGATPELLDYCVLYGRILCASLPAFMLQIMFQSFLVTAEKPVLSLGISIASGLTNIFLDFLFIVVFQWGLAGAAAATAFGQVVGGIVPILYFSRPNNSLLRLTRTKFYGNVLKNTCVNGSSELMTNLSSSVVNILYNFQLMKLAGEDGVAAYGVILYANFIFAAIFIGYSMGSAPVVSYHYGAQNHPELKNLFKKSLTLIAIAGLAMTLLAEGTSAPLTRLFVGYDGDLWAMTCRGFRLYALSFLINGFNIWGSGFFTALGDGVVSAIISFLRTLVFQIAVLLILPVFFGLDGIWLAITVAELLALLVTATFLVKKRTKYHYA